MKVCINTLIYYEQTNLYIRCCRKFIISYQEESKLSALRFLAAILVLLNKLLYDILYDSTMCHFGLLIYISLPMRHCYGI